MKYVSVNDFGFFTCIGSFITQHLPAICLTLEYIGILVKQSGELRIREVK